MVIRRALAWKVAKTGSHGTSHRLSDAQSATGWQFPLDQQGPWALPRKPGGQVQIQDGLLLTSGASAALL